MSAIRDTTPLLARGKPCAMSATSAHVAVASALSWPGGESSWSKRSHHHDPGPRDCHRLRDSRRARLQATDKTTSV